MSSPVPRGHTLTIAERDYMYGAGELKLRIQRVLGQRFVHENDAWVMAEGEEIGWDGVPRGVREVAVRESTLLRSVRGPR